MKLVTGPQDFAEEAPCRVVQETVEGNSAVPEQDADLGEAQSKDASHCETEDTEI